MLDDYLATCKEACDGEIGRLYGPAERGSNGLYDLILDYPLRGGKALRPALSIATCLGLGGHLEAVLPTAATLELYHNAFLIHDDIEDESWTRRGKPTLHIDHGIPIAVNVGDAMLSLSLQPLLDNVERVGLGPALRILRAVSHMTRRTVEGQALELDWVRNNTWQLDDADYLKMVELKTSWYSFITPLQVGAVAAGAGPEQLEPLEALGRHLGAAFQITDDLLNLRADPEDYGKEIGGDLWEGKRTLMLLHAMRNATPDDQTRARADSGQAPTERRRRAQIGRPVGSALRPRRFVPGRTERDRGSRSGTTEFGLEEPRRHSLALRADAEPRVVQARKAGGRRPHSRRGRHPGRPRLVAGQQASRRAGRSRRICTRAHTMTPEVLMGMLAELERIRELTLDLIERDAPRLLPPPPDESAGPERSVFDLLIGARRAVLGNPAAARGLHDVLVAEGRRYADTPTGAELRDGLITSEAVENLRRVWETVSLNVLDGPAAPNAAPSAWAELLADAVIGHGLDDSVLARLRPEGFA